MVIILHNPLSKNRKSRRVTKKIVDHFKKNDIIFRVKSLLKIKDLEDYLNHTHKKHTILLIGGDGTINTFINNTMNIAIAQDIYLKRSGSGNDFLRSLKKQKSAVQYIMQLEHNQEKRYFINGAGMGIDGMISHFVNQSKRKNRFNYFLKTLKAFFIYKPKYMEVKLDDTLYRFKKAWLININNGAFIGGGMKLTPKARLDENKLDVIVVHRVPRLILFFIFISVYFGLHTYLKPFVFYKKATTIEATMFSPQIAQCDGECFENTQEIIVKPTNKHAKFKPYIK